MIYFAPGEDGGPIKSGCSRNVPSRFSSIEAHYKKRLALLDTLPGGPKEEAEIPADHDPERNEVAVKLDRSLVDMARLIAARRGIDVSSMLSEIVRAPIEHAYAQMIRELEGKP